jgi:hypothetical protein
VGARRKEAMDEIKRQIRLEQAAAEDAFDAGDMDRLFVAEARITELHRALIAALAGELEGGAS